jgi:hypothetical protein
MFFPSCSLWGRGWQNARDAGF